MTARASATGFLLSLLMIASPAAADTMTVTLDNVTVDTCDTPWPEAACDIQVVDTVVGDYTPAGNCTWFPQAEGLALLGARLEIDTTALQGVEEVQVDLLEVSGDGRTRIFLYEEGATNFFQFVMSSYNGSPTQQTMPLFTGGFAPGKIVVSAHEALIQEVRIIGNLIVDTRDSSWGVMKSRW